MIFRICTFAASYLLENILGLTATVLTVCSVVKIINSKYATWDRGRTVLNCLWNGKDAEGVNGNISIS